jgi:hypothetical protein
MIVVFLLLLIFAAVCFGLATAGVPVRINLIALGLLLWVLVEIIKVATHL